MSSQNTPIKPTISNSVRDAWHRYQPIMMPLPRTCVYVGVYYTDGVVALISAQELCEQGGGPGLSFPIPFVPRP